MQSGCRFFESKVDARRRRSEQEGSLRFAPPRRTAADQRGHTFVWHDQTRACRPASPSGRWHCCHSPTSRKTTFFGENRQCRPRAGVPFERVWAREPLESSATLKIRARRVEFVLQEQEARRRRGP